MPQGHIVHHDSAPNLHTQKTHKISKNLTMGSVNQTESINNNGSTEIKAIDTLGEEGHFESSTDEIKNSRPNMIEPRYHNVVRNLISPSRESSIESKKTNDEQIINILNPLKQISPHSA